MMEIKTSTAAAVIKRWASHNQAEQARAERIADRIADRIAKRIETGRCRVDHHRIKLGIYTARGESIWCAVAAALMARGFGTPLVTFGVFYVEITLPKT